MATVWFVLVSLMLVAYVVLDGFDLGAGALHLWVARTDDERRSLLRSIGPVWDGNEVWLLAAGGTLFYAFPLLYASSFSGFYLPLNMVLWLLVFRGMGVEFRMHLEADVWRDFFDGVFSLASALLAIFFGAALGNVLRGVPLGPDHYFFTPLWTNFRVGPQPGVLDCYTVLAAVLTLASLMSHGAHYVALKTEGALNARMRRVAIFLGPVVAVLAIFALAATVWIRPELLANYRSAPIGWIFPAIVVASLAGMVYFAWRGSERPAFLCSSAYLVGMLAGAAFALYPTLLPASNGAANSLTIYNAAAGPDSLSAGLWWWSVGMAVALAYFVLVYRMFAGKVREMGHY
jgi:cytochrome d ubiquinol oxidase subunit II